MRLEEKANRLLAITKSKAKMYEFGVEKEYHIKLLDNPKKLLITTLGILGELSSLLVRQSNINTSIIETDDFSRLTEYLVSCAQYFDALGQSALSESNSVYLKLIGSASYYLADMPGSSKILVNSILVEFEPLTNSKIEDLLMWVLVGDYQKKFINKDEAFGNILRVVSETCTRFYQKDIGPEELYKVCRDLRQHVYSVGNDRELLFSDVICAIIIRKIHNSAITCLPLYTGLSLDNWSEALQKDSFIDEFWPAQRLIGEAGVLVGKSSVIQMPTSAGKTKSTELIIRSSFLSGRASLAVVVAPFRSLCREISDSFSHAFNGERVIINELLDVPQIDNSVIEFIKFFHGVEAVDKLPEHSIVISTPEKLIYILRHQPDLVNKIGLLIFDEGHQFDTGTRGVTYELLISSLKQLIKADTQLVMISAVMSNAKSIGDWLYGERGIDIHGTHCLPTERSIAFSSWNKKLGQLRYVDQNSIDNELFFVPRVIEEINLGKRGKEQKDRIFPDRNSTSKSSYMSAYWGVRLCPQGAVAVFCGQKSSVTKICELLVDSYSRNLYLPAPVEFSDIDEIEKIAGLAKLHFGEDSIISKAILLGVLPHSTNIPNGLRVAAEFAIQNSLAKFVVCTSTLAQGVNLPIKYLIISGVYQAGEKISTRDFHNLIGRAGRSGLHTEGSVIFSSPEIFDKKNTSKGRRAWSDIKKLFNFDNAEQCASSLKKIIEPFPDIPEVDVIDFISDRDNFSNLVLKYAEEKKLDLSKVIFQLDFREKALDAIESYLLAHIADLEEDPLDNYYEDVAAGTLAYSMAIDEEKDLLIEAFKLISNKVLKVPVERRRFYGKSLLGVNDLNKISDWLDENYDWLGFDESINGTLEYIWPLILKLCRNKKIQKFLPQESVLLCATKWIKENSYHELVSELANQEATYLWGKRNITIKIDNVIELTDKILGYDCMLIVGAIADVVEGIHGESDVTETLRNLQKCIKYGLNQPLTIWLYEKGFVDRELCKEICFSLTKMGINPQKFNYDILETHQNVVQDVLSRYPSYFSNLLN